jgi:hypothetical protein
MHELKLIVQSVPESNTQTNLFRLQIADAEGHGSSSPPACQSSTTTNSETPTSAPSLKSTQIKITIS